MDYEQRFQLTTLVLVAIALVHAVVTWPLADVAVLFLGGATLAFVGEVATVRAGLLEHRLRPQVLGVPLVVLLAWPATVYVFYRLALLAVPPGVPAAVLAAVLATLSDVLQDPMLADRGLWDYPESAISELRYRGVPWWNFAGWLVIVFATAMLPTWLG